MTLLELQRRMAGALMTPLAPSTAIAKRTSDGKSMREEAEALITPNSRLTSLERLEIYSRSYWFRILDSFREDFPGLCAVLGERAFQRLSKAYLAEVPSASFTLRNLGSRLEEWLGAHPEYAARNFTLAMDMVRLEWAHIEAFDAREEKPLGPEDLIELDAGIEIGLQPCIQLIALHYAVDDLRIRVQTISDQHATSNAVVHRKNRTAVRRYTALRPEPTFVAVHRMNFVVYYRRLTPGEFGTLEELRGGKSLGQALEAAAARTSLSPAEFSSELEQWFAAWSRLGWLCFAEGAAPQYPA